MLDVKTVAERLSVSIFTVYREIEQCKLPAYQIRGTVRVKETDLDAYLEAQRVKPDNTPILKKDTRPTSKKPTAPAKLDYGVHPLYTGRTSKKKREAALAGYKGL